MNSSLGCSGVTIAKTWGINKLLLYQGRRPESLIRLDHVDSRLSSAISKLSLRILRILGILRES